MLTENAVLKALDRPRKVFAILKAVDPGGREEIVQDFLMGMRDRGLVRFDIKKETWRRP